MIEPIDLDAVAYHADHGRVLVVGSCRSGKSLAVNAIAASCRRRGMEPTVADDAVSLEAGALITAIGEAMVPECPVTLGAMLRSLEVVVILRLRLLEPTAIIVQALKGTGFRLGGIMEPVLHVTPERTALVFTRCKDPRLVGIPLPPPPDTPEGLTIAEPSGKELQVERIKAAMCRADGPAPDRRHYDAMAREIAGEIERTRRHQLPSMTDPSNALVSFQAALDQGQIQVHRCSLDPNLYVHLDHPNGMTRFSYARIDGETVTVLVLLVHCEPIDDIPCFQIGYAVPEDHRGQGLAGNAVKAAIAELKHGLAQNGVSTFYVEAVIAEDNEASRHIAAATISAEPIAITDGPSGKPALQYLRKITR